MTTREQIVEVLQGAVEPLSCPEIAEKLELSYGCVRWAMLELTCERIVQIVDWKIYKGSRWPADTFWLRARMWEIGPGVGSVMRRVQGNIRRKLRERRKNKS